MVQTIHVNLNMLSYFDSAKGQVLLVGLICLWYVPLDSQCSPHEYFKDRGGTLLLCYLPAIARSPICCLFPTSNRADARMFSLPCAYSCPGIYNAITAMAVSSSFNCFKLYTPE